MIQTRGGFRFTSEPNECLLRICLVTEDTFERHDPVRKSLARAINNTHAAASDFFQNLIIRDAPIGIAHVDLVEHLLECLRRFHSGVESEAEHAMQAKAASQARC